MNRITGIWELFPSFQSIKSVGLLTVKNNWQTEWVYWSKTGEILPWRVEKYGFLTYEISYRPNFLNIRHQLKIADQIISILTNGKIKRIKNDRRALFWTFYNKKKLLIRCTALRMRCAARGTRSITQINSPFEEPDPGKSRGKGGCFGSGLRAQCDRHQARALIPDTGYWIPVC